MNVLTIAAAGFTAGRYRNNGVLEFDGHVEIAPGLGEVSFAYVNVRGDFVARAGTNIALAEDISAGGNIAIAGNIRAGGHVEAGWGIQVGGDLDIGGHVEAGWGIEVAGYIRTGGYVEAGWGIVVKAQPRP